jgi:hypothetical protein
MRGIPKNGWRGVVLALLGSYVSDLRAWVGRLATGYLVATALLLGGVLAFFAAVAVGITALFHFLERSYGVDIAYGAIGGGLLVLAILLFSAGWIVLRREPPALPRPYRQAQIAKQALVGSAARHTIGSKLGLDAARSDALTRLLFGAAVTALVGWITASRLRSSKRKSRMLR